jgi:hypothetical protein
MIVKFSVQKASVPCQFIQISIKILKIYYVCSKINLTTASFHRLKVQNGTIFNTISHLGFKINSEVQGLHPGAIKSITINNMELKIQN